MFVFWQISHQNLIRWGIFFYAQKIAKSTILGYPRTKNGLMVGESYMPCKSLALLEIVSLCFDPPDHCHQVSVGQSPHLSHYFFPHFHQSQRIMAAPASRWQMPSAGVGGNQREDNKKKRAVALIFSCLRFSSGFPCPRPACSPVRGRYPPNPNGIRPG